LINRKDRTDKNALDYALQRSDSLEHIQIAEKLILAGGISDNEIFPVFGPAVRSGNYNLRRNEGLAPIHYAVIGNHEGLISFLMEKNIDVNLKSTSGATPLHEAARKGNIPVIKYLIEKGAEVNSQDARGNTPLHTGIPPGAHLEVISILIGNKADPNIRDLHGDTPLHIAITLDRSPEIIEALINSGSDVHIRNIQGQTPLYIAVHEKRTKIIPILLEGDAELFAADNSGITPFDVAFKVNDSLFDILVTPKTVTQRDMAGNTLLHATIRNRGTPEQIAKILNQRPLVDATNRAGDTALHIAVRTNQRHSGEFLISRGANIFSNNAAGESPIYIALSASSIRQWMINHTTIQAKDGLGNNMLHYAAQWNLDNAIPIIIRSGISVESANETGETPLFMAVKTDSTSTIRVLNNNNANINARDSQGNSLLHAAVRWNARRSAALLISSGMDVNIFSLNGNTPLHDAVILGMSDIETLLIREKANLEVRNIEGNTPFMEAVRVGFVPSMEKLAAAGADSSTRNSRGDTPLHFAVNSERIELVRALLRMNASIHARNTRNITPFQASIGISEQMVRTLLTRNRINQPDDMGNSALHIALQENASQNILRAIINQGARVNAVDSNGKTPLRIAIDLELWESAKLLADSGANPFTAAVDSKTPAELAFEKGEACVRAVFSGAAINTKDSSNNTILHIGARYGSPELINVLLELGASKSARNISSELPYEIAVRWNRNENADALR
jgi:ankyrin repeat protein